MTWSRKDFLDSTQKATNIKQTNRLHQNFKLLLIKIALKKMNRQKVGGKNLQSISQRTCRQNL